MSSEIKLNNTLKINSTATVLPNFRKKKKKNDSRVKVLVQNFRAV